MGEENVWAEEKTEGDVIKSKLNSLNSGAQSCLDPFH